MGESATLHKHHLQSSNEQARKEDNTRMSGLGSAHADLGLRTTPFGLLLLLRSQELLEHGGDVALRLLGLFRGLSVLLGDQVLEPLVFQLQGRDASLQRSVLLGGLLDGLLESLLTHLLLHAEAGTRGGVPATLVFFGGNARGLLYAHGWGLLSVLALRSCCRGGGSRGGGGSRRRRGCDRGLRGGLRSRLARSRVDVEGTVGQGRNGRVLCVLNRQRLGVDGVHGRGNIVDVAEAF